MRINYVRKPIFLIFLTGVMLLPVMVIVQEGLTAEGGRWDEVIYRPFLAACGRSWGLLVWMTVVGGGIGSLLGTIASIWRFPLKGLALVMLGFPLILPPFVLAIGIQSLQSFFSFSTIVWLDGRWGCFWSGLLIIVPISVYGTILAASQITASEREVARMSQGSLMMARMILFRVIPVSFATAVLGGLLVIADPGTGQIMGYHGISGDILVAFSARNDFQLAAMKALSLLLMFSPLMLTVCWILNRRLDYRKIAFRTSGKNMIEPSWVVSVLLGGIYALLCAVPIISSMVGLVRPLMRPPTEKYMVQAKEMFIESLGTTLLYGLTSGVVAVVLAGTLLILVHKSKRLTEWLLAGGLVLLAVPSCISSLGMISMGTSAPAGLDFLFRSHWLVGLSLGIRFAPVALLFLFVANVDIPTSLGETARTYQIPKWKRLLYINLPIRLPALVLSLIAVMILTLADVSSIALLQPPGGASFGSHLFAVMDSASEKMVASLCVVYLIVPLTTLGLLGAATLWKNCSTQMK
jgi:ABC-type Fe3+ transport system permease subunit